MLNAKDIDTVMNQCRIELTGVSDALLKSMMYEVMDEFFRDTSSWTEDIVFNAVSTTDTYTLVPSEGQIIRLKYVLNSDGSQITALMQDIPTLVLSAAPTVNQQYTATVVKNVSLPLTRDGYPIAPEWVLKQWHLGIKHGIVGYLMMSKKKSYSDAEGAKYNLMKFRQYVQNARSQVLRANTEGAARWRFPQSYRTTSQRGGVPPLSGGERSF